MRKVCCVCSTICDKDLFISEFLTDDLAPTVQYAHLLQQCLSNKAMDNIRLLETDQLCSRCTFMLQKFHKFKVEIESIERFIVGAYQKHIMDDNSSELDCEENPRTDEIAILSSPLLVRRTYCGRTKRPSSTPIVKLPTKRNESSTECFNCGKMKSSINVCDHIDARLDNSINKLNCEVKNLHSFPKFIKSICLNYSTEMRRNILW